MKRAVRRHHLKRMKPRVANPLFSHSRDKIVKQIGMLATTRTMCSCAMCGNPRRYFGLLTMQERRDRDGGVE